MKQELKIGILKLQPGWQIVLNQLGVTYEEIDFLNNLTSEKYSVLIINDNLNTEKFSYINEYLKSGGAVFDVGYFIPALKKSKFTPQKVKHLIPNYKDHILNELRPIDIYSKVKKYDYAQFIDKSVYLGQVENGFIAYLAFNPNNLILDVQSIRKQFYNPNGEFPNEGVAKISKNEIRKLIEIILKWLHIQRNLPYLHLWYFPDKVKNIFLFRIDSDYSTWEQIKKLYGVAHKHNIKMTWFLHGKAHEEWFSYFKEMKNQELAVHGYKHFTYDSYSQNYKNIKTCIDLFNKEAISYSGYASPFAVWNNELAKAVEDLEFEYSSEFLLDYDNLPFSPYVNSRFSSVLQVPIHPISIGNLKRIKLTDEEMINYYKYVIGEKSYFNEPLAFYDHPGHSYLNVLSEIFNHINQLEIRNITLGEYSSWWKKRSKVEFCANADVEGINIDFSKWDGSVSVCVWHPKKVNSYSIINKKGYIAIKEMEFENKESTFCFPTGYKNIRKFNPKLIYYDFLEKLWRKED